MYVYNFFCIIFVVAVAWQLSSIRKRPKREPQKKKKEMAECASGCDHSLFLDSLGSVWSCGHNQQGELGLGHNSNLPTPQKISNLPPIISVSAGVAFSLFVDANGSVWSCGYNQYGQLGLGDVNHRNIPEQITNL